METWGRDRAPEIMDVVGAALPGEALTEDDVVTVLFDDPDPVLVIGDAAGEAVGAAVIRRHEGRRTAHVQLVAVHPRAQRRGHGRRVVEELQRWAFAEQGCDEVAAGAGAPFYLFAGVDTAAMAALCLFESLGYRPTGAAVNLSFPSRVRAPAPPGIEVRRVLEEPDATAAVGFCERYWPAWVAELERGIEHGACHAACADGGAVVGFACHSVSRLAWLGPIGTHPERRGRGIGSALLSAAAKDVMAAGFDRVEVSWAGALRFYAKAAEASVSRVFRSLALTRPA